MIGGNRGGYYCLCFAFVIALSWSGARVRFCAFYVFVEVLLLSALVRSSPLLCGGVCFVVLISALPLFRSNLRSIPLLC